MRYETKQYFLAIVDLNVKEAQHKSYILTETRLVRTFDTDNIDEMVNQYYKSKSNDEIEYEVFNTKIIDTIE